MGKRRKTGLAVLFIGILAGAALAILHRPEPVYRGETLSYWLGQYNEVQDFSKPTPADEAIRAMGTNTLPLLLSDIERGYSPSAMERMVARWCPQRLWIRSLIFGEDHRSAPALMALKALGSEAKPILPGLEKLFENSRTTETAAKGFFFIGPASIPTLEDACRSTNVAVRVQAALMIAKLKSSLRTAFAYSSHKSPMNGRPVLSVGWAFSVDGEQERITALAEGLQNPDPAVRRANIDALLSPVASTTLVGLMEPANAKVIPAAREALRQINLEAATEAGRK